MEKITITRSKVFEMETNGGRSDGEYIAELTLDCTAGAFWNVYHLSHNENIGAEIRTKLYNIMDALTEVDDLIREVKHDITGDLL